MNHAVETRTYLGFDIGGTKCAVALGNSAGQIVDRIAFPTNEPAGPQPAIQQLLSSAALLLARHRVSPSAAGVACGSPLDPELGIIQSPPNLPSWQDVPIVKILKERLGLPVFLDNDANAGALAEFSFGAGRGYKSIIFITFGTGCGSGLILNGRIYRGINCYAGEIGHIRLAEDGPSGYRKRGSFEGFCSGGGLAQLAQSMRKDYPRTCLSEKASAADIGAAAQQNDPLALAVLEVSGRYLGKGLAILLDVINPQRVIIGSIFVRCEKFLRPAMETALAEEALSYTRAVCEIVPAALGEAVGDYAAMSVAHYGYLYQNDQR